MLDKLNSQFNMKDLDLGRLIKPLDEKQNSYVKLGLVIGSLLLVGLIFNNHRTKEQALRAQVSLAQQKIEAIKGRDAAIRDLKNFKSSQPKKINEFELIALISNYAKSYNVSINSLSPAESKDMGLYDVIDIKFNAVADDFKNMMLFLRKIEKSNSSLRINSWTGHYDNGKITFAIEINAVLIHP